MAEAVAGKVLGPRPGKAIVSFWQGDVEILLRCLSAGVSVAQCARVIYRSRLTSTYCSHSGCCSSSACRCSCRTGDSESGRDSFLILKHSTRGADVWVGRMGHWGGRSGNFDRGAGDCDSVLQYWAGQPHDQGIPDSGKRQFLK